MRTITCFMVILIAATQSMAFTGHDWIYLADREKIVYVRGNKDGAFTGCYEALGYKNEKGAIECAKFASGGYEGENVRDIIAAIDRFFFASPKNRNMQMVGVVGVAARFLDGEDVSNIFPGGIPGTKKQNTTP